MGDGMADYDAAAKRNFLVLNMYEMAHFARHASHIYMALCGIDGFVPK